MVPYERIGWVLAGSAALMAALWLVQRRTRDAGIVDLGWTLAMGAAGVAYAATGDGHPWRRGAVTAIAGTWSIRLAWHLWTDRIRPRPGHAEDGRYAELRARWGDGAEARFLAFFLFQAALVAVLSVPHLVAASNPHEAPSPWDLVALGVALTALLGARAADAQLAAWRRDPANRGRACRTGLWRYSRHPNYFFEWLHWFAWPALAAGGPHGWVALGGPVLMLLLIVKVTGIPPTEARAIRSRGEDYRAYQRETSAFFPWFPRRAGGAR
ncbi:MAG: hypothetical protein HMLKMBBP_00002 [Planctomycetes bacterium]|nr:hypothetical protein [Planctomycetota bacterium]